MQSGLSAETFAIPLEGGQILVYAPLRKAAFVANAAMVNYLADFHAGTRDPRANQDGSRAEFLRRLEIVDGGEEQQPVTTFEGEPCPTSLTLFLTTACNLRCTYCYASAGETPLRSMDFSVAKSGIDFIIANALKLSAGAIELSYHGGGEPTVHWKILRDSFEYASKSAERHGLKLHTACASNGYLNETQIDWLIKNIDSVSLSFDGVPEVNDRHRVTPAGKGSSARVINTMRRFDAAGYSYGVRVTVTADQILRLPESIDFICTNFSPVRIQVEPSYQMGRWQEAPSAETAAFVEAFRSAKAIALTHGKDIVYSAARLDSLSNHFCGVSQDLFCLSPDGNVSGCYESFQETGDFADTFFYGKPMPGNPGYEFDLGKLENLRHQAVQYREFCKGCFARWNCSGDCYHKALTVNGASDFMGSDRCHITRELTKDLLLERIYQSGGFFWHEEGGGTQEYSSGKEFLISSKTQSHESATPEI